VLESPFAPPQNDSASPPQLLPKLLAATPTHPALKVLERFLDVSAITGLRTKEDAALRAGTL